MTFQFPTNDLLKSDELPANDALPRLKLKSLPSGSGKSRSIFKNVVPSDKPTIIITPTYKLSCQYEKYFREKGIVPVVISSERFPDRSAHQDFIDACAGSNKIILVNRIVAHNTNADMSGYDIYEDEFSDILDIIKFDNAKASHSIMTKLLHCVKLTESALYYEVELTPFGLEMARNGWSQAIIKNDPDFLRLCKRIASRHYRVYILASNYAKYLECKVFNIQFWAVMLPTIFGDSVPTMVGANGEDQLVSKLWANLAVFEDAENISGDYLDFSEKMERIDPVTGKMIGGGHVIYVSQETVTGEKLKTVGHQKAYDAVQDLYYSRFGDDAHIYGFNKNPLKRGKQFEWKLKNAKMVQLVPHGQNDSQDIHNAVCLGAQYYDPATYNFLWLVFGLTGEEVDRAFGLERLYQFAMRTSVRDRKCEEPFNLIVWDRKSAEFLQEKMPFVTIEYVDIGIPEFRKNDKPKTVPKTAAERMANKKEKDDMIKNDHENTEQYEGFKLIVWENKYAQNLSTADGSWFDLGEYLANDHFNYKPKSKDKAKCFTEGYLTDVTNHKLVSNIMSTRLAILDIDTVKRNPQDLSDFLHEQGWSHFIFNSHSSTPLDPKIRVVIGLSEAVNPVNLKHILQLVRADIDARFGEGVYVIDDSKMTINSKFHSPSVSEYLAPLFIKRHIMKVGKFEAQFLDVKFFLTRNPIFVKKNKPAVVDRSSVSRRGDKKQGIENVLDRWSVGAGRGLGSANFYQAAVDLKKLGLSREDCIQILTENRHRFGHGQDRDAVYTVGRVFDRSKYAA
jgi:hypothetical protein